jgi:rRNA maturation endonuclease Nob1
MTSDEILVMYECSACGEEHYFSADSLPGGDEFCEFCDCCGGKLAKEGDE